MTRLIFSGSATLRPAASVKTRCSAEASEAQPTRAVAAARNEIKRLRRLMLSVSG